jgi:hypothetical protein
VLVGFFDDYNYVQAFFDDVFLVDNHAAGRTCHPYTRLVRSNIFLLNVAVVSLVFFFVASAGGFS